MRERGEEVKEKKRREMGVQHTSTHHGEMPDYSMFQTPACGGGGGSADTAELQKTANFKEL